jgi:hypothetical protein
VISKNGVTTVGQGVVYASDEGLKLLIDRNAQVISEPVHYYTELPFRHDESFTSVMSDYLPLIDETDLRDMLEDGNLSYDSAKGEILLSITTLDVDAFPFTYVFQLAQKTWYKRSEVFRYYISAAMGNVGIDVSGKFFLLHKETDEARRVLLISNPWDLGNDGLKMLEKTIIQLRKWSSVSVDSQVISDHTAAKLVILLYVSNDGETFVLANQYVIDNNKLNRLLLRKLSASYRYFTLIIRGHMESIQLDNIFTQYNIKEVNRLR